MTSLFACCGGKRENHRWRSDAGQKTKNDTPSTKSPLPPPSQQLGGKVGLCGVGVVFKPLAAPDGRVQLQVYSVAPASPAERSGLIMPEDILTHVDGKSVTEMSAEQVAPLVVGPIGTEVTLRFRRGAEEFDATMYRVWGSAQSP
mmetsp:Transcript_1684/g.3799  ORF Transcript_1684/g.3799 Transcript_1684/m.3799 type:complete len:145 (-) Transcript_1684:119-553(-)|eukprot:CAMPEP_0177696850 /NCGR_PEP_ID=MMETSP0484_2-20121128/4200_1 /TAXON_ID=354590 /ORGANISM="Rhodomonas lens, Strain RHODO" /LENGTH=144 /DNA_ID=CAMNT_0019207849 /DNA_START=49 /DNA_END=483 /DNA_ORIENTATION=-